MSRDADPAATRVAPEALLGAEVEMPPPKAEGARPSRRMATTSKLLHPKYGVLSTAFQHPVRSPLRTMQGS